MIKDLGHIEVVEGKCEACDYNEPGCEVLCRQFTPFGHILRKKEKWETCNRENTEAGDIVRVKESATGSEYLVDYVHKNNSDFVIDGRNYFNIMECYEVKIK